MRKLRKRKIKEHDSGRQNTATDVAFNFLEMMGGKEGRNQKAVLQAKSARKETTQST